VFAAFLLIFVGVFTTIINLGSMSTRFEYVLGNMSFVFIIIVPILTMHVIAAERRQKTDQLLYSLPLKMSDIVFGKYFAMLVPLAIPVGIAGIYPLILSRYGEINMATVYSSIFGFFLLGAALLAIGLFLSSLTENQAVAAGLCVVVTLGNYFLADLASFVPATAFASLTVLIVAALVVGVVFAIVTRSIPAAVLLIIALEAALFVCYKLWTEKFESLITKIVEQLSLYEQFYQFLNNIFDVRSAVYLVSVAAVFVFLCIQSLEKRRWGE
jgi:ABC-2 type transport system permease protein